MCQVLFHIFGLPIYGFGFMLFVAFVACTWLAGRRAQKQGIAREHLQDLAVWIFVGGIIGARIVYMVQYGVPLRDFYRIWEGGLVFYGSALGGVAAYGLAYYFIIRKHGLNGWQLADIVAPSIALGLCLGRVGCLLNGCCYGQVACPHCVSVHFPLSAPARYTLVHKGYQTAAGFAIAEHDPTGRLVRAVEPGSPADEAGLKADDLIVAVDGNPVPGYQELWEYLGPNWPRGKTDLVLTVGRAGRTVTLLAFYPKTIGLHPTQLYETVSMALLVLLLLAYEPFQKRRGELIILMMLSYSVHRFINESLRDDTERYSLFGQTAPLTLSQWGSIVLLLTAIVLLILRLRRPPDLPGRPDVAPALATV